MATKHINNDGGIAGKCSTHLVHHGAAANSNPHVVLWIARRQRSNTASSCSIRSEIVYASHSIINVARLVTVSVNGNEQQLWNVYQTLRTQSTGVTTPDSGQQRIITSLASLSLFDCKSSELSSYCYGLACGFSDGTISVWLLPLSKQINSEEADADTDHNNSSTVWQETVVIPPTPPPPSSSSSSAAVSITNLDGLLVQHDSEDAEDDGDGFATCHRRRSIWLITCTCDGAYFYNIPLPSPLCARVGGGVEQGKSGVVMDATTASTTLRRNPLMTPPPAIVTPATPQTILSSAAANTVRIHFSLGTMYLLIGTAEPRHNKIWVYTVDMSNTVHVGTPKPIVFCWGGLLGHEDWITSSAWSNQSLYRSGTMGSTATALKDGSCANINNNNTTVLLASASQDAKIRLWKFSKTFAPTTAAAAAAAPVRKDDDTIPPLSVSSANVVSVDDHDDDGLEADVDDAEEHGEARLEIKTNDSGNSPSTTRVTLEALLIGHEESVTAVQWHPCSRDLYGEEHILLSSSMDRSIFLWACTTSNNHTTNVWTPLTRVGSAGGILGGSVGSTLLGFLQAQLDPINGKSLMGHAFGGALHIWSIQDEPAVSVNHGAGYQGAANLESLEERAALRKWRATSCVTGHFAGVTGLCWESSTGEYLLTVSTDQTCRLWAPVNITNSNNSDSVWVELARPQVHGYDLTAIASLSTAEHKHLMVSGADEKELRVYDAPMTTIRMLRAVGSEDQLNTTSNKTPQEDRIGRVERAFIPSLGLSNKATATEGAEEDVAAAGESGSDTGGLEDNLQLPLERDLGAVSLWPEVRKLFGHNSEIYCVSSTVSARSGLSAYFSSPYARDVWVASSAKAREAEAASIRIWDAHEGKCIQVLDGAHKSTVAALSFSPDGRYLASSGKDRRLCIWRRTDVVSLDLTQKRDVFHLAVAVDSAHKRIIWSVHFCPFIPFMLASGSRDGCIKIWQLSEYDETDNMQVEIKELVTFSPHTTIDGKKPDAVTALAFAPIPVKNNTIIALGLECGLMEVWGISLSPGSSGVQQSTLLYCIPLSHCHIASVTMLAWRPYRQNQSLHGDCAELLLASAALDHGCRIIRISFGDEDETSESMMTA